jgi:hypothetical protein
MAKGEKFSEPSEAIRYLNQMGHTVSDRKITIRKKEDGSGVGLKVWSAVDYLQNFHRYVWNI